MSNELKGQQEEDKRIARCVSCSIYIVLLLSVVLFAIPIIHALWRWSFR